jgi:hypothetical protein
VRRLSSLKALTTDPLTVASGGVAVGLRNITSW